MRMGKECVEPNNPSNGDQSLANLGENRNSVIQKKVNLAYEEGD